MKGTYITIEIVLVAALLRFGEKVGTNNMWFVIVAIIVSHFVMEFLYELRLYSETHKLKSKKKSNTYNVTNHKSTHSNKPITKGVTDKNKTVQLNTAAESISDNTVKLNISEDVNTLESDFFKIDIS